jgi:hypothetical protein
MTKKMIVKILIAALLILLLIGGCITPQPKFIETSKGLVEVASDPVNLMAYLPLLLVGGVVVGIFAFLNGSKMGLPAVLSCLAGLGLTIAVIEHTEIISIVSIVGFVIAMGALGLSFFSKKQGIILTKVKNLKGK